MNCLSYNSWHYTPIVSFISTKIKCLNYKSGHGPHGTTIASFYKHISSLSADKCGPIAIGELWLVNLGIFPMYYTYVIEKSGLIVQ